MGFESGGNGEKRGQGPSPEAANVVTLSGPEKRLSPLSASAGDRRTLDAFESDWDSLEASGIDPVILGYFRNELGKEEASRRLAGQSPEVLSNVRNAIRDNKAGVAVWLMELLGPDFPKEVSQTIFEQNEKLGWFGMRFVEKFEQLKRKYGGKDKT